MPLAPHRLACPLLLALAGFTLPAGAQPTGGTTASPSPTIEACFVPASGSIYRIDTPASPAPGAPKACFNVSHVRFIWNQQGPKGEPGTLPRTASNQIDLSGIEGWIASGVLGTGPIIDVSGSAPRTFWYPRKAAFRAGSALADEWGHTNIGDYSFAAGYANKASGAYAVAMGNQSQALGLGTVALGEGADARGLHSYAVGTFSKAYGDYSLAFGRDAVASGAASASIGSNNQVSGIRGAALGADNTVSGRSSAAIGEVNTVTGGSSQLIGMFSNVSGDFARVFGVGSTASGSYATAIGSQATASGLYSMAVGVSVTASGERSLALGNFASTGDRRGSMVIGDASTTTALTAASDNQFLVRAAGGITLYSNAQLTAGVSVAPGSGSWQSLSDVRRKTAFRALDGETVLAKLRAMPIRSWQYRTQDASIRHIGPTAQDFRAAFRVGETDTTIASVDADGVSLAAAKALERRTAKLLAAVEALQAETKALRNENQTLRRRLDAIEPVRAMAAARRARR